MHVFAGFSCALYLVLLGVFAFLDGLVAVDFGFSLRVCVLFICVLRYGLLFVVRILLL